MEAKARLRTGLNETATRLLRAKSSSRVALQSPLGAFYGVPWLPLAGPSFTGHAQQLSPHLMDCNAALSKIFR